MPLPEPITIRECIQRIKDRNDTRHNAYNNGADYWDAVAALDLLDNYEVVENPAAPEIPTGLRLVPDPARRGDDCG